MKFDRLYYFESAARHESFTLAAKEYHIAPSAISQQIKILEKSLGFSLFNRTSNKKVVLTNAGAVFYKRTKEILSLYNDAVEEAKLELSPKINTLTIGISESVPLFSLNKIIYKVKNKYPDIEIKLLQVESTHCKSPLIDGTYDILFTNQVLKLEEEDNLDKKAISYVEFGVLVDSSCPLSEKEYIDFEDLITSNLPIYTLDIYEKILLNHLPQLENSIKTEQSINLLLALGYLNKGIIFTTYEQARIFNLGSMCFKPLIDSSISFNNNIYYFKDNNNWILKEFLDLL